jgi:D-alanyl-D-alanine carboxypeptidase
MKFPLTNLVIIILLTATGYLVGENILVTDQITNQVVAVMKSSFPSLKLEASGEINLGARAFLSAYLAPDGSLEIIVEKNGHQPVPIASVTKLMTALIATNEFDPATATTIVETEAIKTFTVKTLLNSLLVESNNDSANALAKLGGNQEFINKMNGMAQSLGMKKTHYFNPSGLDAPGGLNFSSAYDLLILVKQILATRPEILALTRQVSVPIIETNGREDHLAQTTDQLLTNNSWPAEIVGGKTGKTDLAKTNLVLVLRDKATNGYLINVILGSDDHFSEMTKLIDWVYASYEF